MEIYEKKLCTTKIRIQLNMNIGTPLQLSKSMWMRILMNPTFWFLDIFWLLFALYGIYLFQKDCGFHGVNTTTRRCHKCNKRFLLSSVFAIVMIYHIRALIMGGRLPEVPRCSQFLKINYIITWVMLENF